MQDGKRIRSKRFQNKFDFRTLDVADTGYQPLEEEGSLHDKGPQQHLIDPLLLWDDRSLSH
jgi:hypothetical protein